MAQEPQPAPAAPPSIVAALVEVKRAVGAVGKDGRNVDHGYNFRGVDTVVNAVAGALIDNGVLAVPRLQEMHRETVEVGRNRTPMALVTVRVAYEFHGPAGDSLVVAVPGEAFDSGDKAVPKAMSVAYRIALLQLLTLPTHDVDPDAQSYERSPAPGVATESPLLAEIGRLADTLRVERAAILSKWAELYPGRDIRTGTDEELAPFLDRLRDHAAAQQATVAAEGVPA